MTQFSTLTPEVEAIVKKFFKADRNLFSKAGTRLMTSLYALTDDSDPRVLSILKEYQIPLDESFSKEEIDAMMIEYPAVIKYCFDHRSERGTISTTRADQKYLPQLLIDLCVGLAEPEAGSSVYVPFSGDADFAYFAGECEVDGCESSPMTWAISSILLQSIHATSHIMLDEEDTHDLGDKQYDYIFSFPPMTSGRDSRKVVDVIYDLITKHLKEKGGLYCILPMSFCYDRSGWFDVRKILWDYKGQYCMCVIALPPILQPISAVKLCLLYVEKCQGDTVALMDASGEEFLTRHDIAGGREVSLKVQSIIESLQKGDERCIWIGDSSAIDRYTLNLTPARYLLPQRLPHLKQGEKYIELSEILEIQKGSVKWDDLYLVDVPPVAFSHQLENCYVSRSSLPEVNLNIAGRALWGKNWLFMVRGDRPSLCFVNGVSEKESWTDDTGFVEYGEGIRIYPNMLAFRFKPDSEKLVVEEYVLRMLLSDFVADQVKMLGYGRTLRIDASNFEIIRIPVPSIEQQKAFVDSQKGVDAKQMEAKYQKQMDELRDEVSFQRHTLGQTIGLVNNWWEILNDQINENDGTISLEDAIDISGPKTVRFIFDTISGYLKELGELNKIFTMNIKYVAEDVDIRKFIKKFVEDNPSPNFRYIYKPDDITFTAQETIGNVGVFFLPDEYNIRSIRFPNEALKVIFKNIITNADKYGFAQRDGKDHIVVIEYFSDGSDAIVEISNNGNPLPDSISEKNIFELGVTSSESKGEHGIGAYQIKKLMQEFDGDVELISKPDDPFPVTYRLIFHKCSIEAADLSTLSDNQRELLNNNNHS